MFFPTAAVAAMETPSKKNATRTAINPNNKPRFTVGSWTLKYHFASSKTIGILKTQNKPYCSQVISFDPPTKIERPYTANDAMYSIVEHNNARTIFIGY